MDTETELKLFSILSVIPYILAAILSSVVPFFRSDPITLSSINTALSLVFLPVVIAETLLFRSLARTLASWQGFGSWFGFLGTLILLAFAGPFFALLYWLRFRKTKPLKPAPHHEEETSSLTAYDE